MDGWMDRAAGHCFLLLAALALTTAFPRTDRRQASSQETDIIHTLTHIAAQRYNRLSDQDVTYIPLRLSHLTEQLVSGVKYDFNILLGRTLCKKDGEKTLQNCQLHVAALEKGVKCNFSVLLMPWLNETKVLHQLCSQEDFLKDVAEISLPPSNQDKLPSKIEKVLDDVFE